MDKKKIAGGYYSSRELILELIKRKKLPLKIDDDDMESHYMLCHTGDVPLSISVPYFIGFNIVCPVIHLQSFFYTTCFKCQLLWFLCQHLNT